MKTPKKLLISSAATVCGFSLAFGQADERAGPQPGAQEQPPVMQDQQERDQDQEFGMPDRDRDLERQRDRDRDREVGMTGQGETHQASELEGSRVEDQAGERLGTVDSIAVDLETGELSYIVVSSGGFLGIGDDLKLVPPDAVEIEREEGVVMGGLVVRLDIDEQQWEDAPSVEDRDEIQQFAQSDRGREVYQHYGVEWEQRSASEFGARDRQDQDHEFGSPTRDEDEGIDINGQERDSDLLNGETERDDQEFGARTQPGAEQRGTQEEAGVQQDQADQQQEWGARDRDDEDHDARGEYGARDRDDKDKEDRGEYGARDHEDKDKEDRGEFGARDREGGELKLSNDLQGMNLQGSQEEEIGQIDDLLVDIQNGQVTFVLISPDTGFWQAGDDDTYAIPPQAITVLGEDRLQVNITPDQLEQAQRLSHAEIQDRAREHARDPDQARTQPQVYRFDADDEAIFGRPDRERDARERDDRDDDETFDFNGDEDERSPQAQPQPGTQDRY